MNLAVDSATLEQAANAACRAALRAGLSDVDARDLAQDALVRALTSAQPPAGVPLPAWVYGIAKNLGRDHAKSAKRREIVVDLPPDDVHDEDLATVLAVRRAVDELPPPLRDVVTLHELEDNSLRATATALQIPFDTAKDRLRRARQQLRSRLTDDSALDSERAHTRRRASGYAGAIVAGLYALLGDRASATAATSGVAALATTGARVVPLWLAGAIGTALLAGGFVAGRVSAPSRDDNAIAPAIAMTPDDDPVEAPIAVAQTTELTAAPASTPRAARSAKPAVAEPPRPDHEEQLLVDRARAGLRRGMHDEALVTLMEHARRFEHGDLAEERDVLLIEAYVRAGKPAIAKKRIERYRVEHSDGVLQARVDALAAQLP